jgi:hypothetical protein
MNNSLLLILKRKNKLKYSFTYSLLHCLYLIRHYNNCNGLTHWVAALSPWRVKRCIKIHTFDSVGHYYRSSSTFPHVWTDIHILGNPIVLSFWKNHKRQDKWQHAFVKDTTLYERPFKHRRTQETAKNLPDVGEIARPIIFSPYSVSNSFVAKCCKMQII